MNDSLEVIALVVVPSAEVEMANVVFVAAQLLFSRLGHAASVYVCSRTCRMMSAVAFLLPDYRYHQNCRSAFSSRINRDAFANVFWSRDVSNAFLLQTCQQMTCAGFL